MAKGYEAKQATRRRNQRARRAAKPAVRMNDIVRTIYLRFYDNIDLDVSGNISVGIKVNDVENNSGYPSYVHALFGEIRILSVKVRFVANSALVYGQIGMTALYMTPYHTDVPSSMNSATAAETIQTRIYSVADPSIKEMRWVADLGNSDEASFYPTTGNSLSHVIPAGLGGIYVYSDGPVSAAGTSVGTILTTWKCEVRQPYLIN